MITAKTTQLLDANNYNISPAVCVDSLYFERNVENKTYRMSMRNRTLVAGDSINLNVSVPEKIERLTDFKIPYVYFRNVDGTSDTTGRILQVDSEFVNLGEKLHSAVKDEILADYLSKDDAKNEYLRLDNQNYVKQILRIGELPQNNITLNTSDVSNAFIRLHDSEFEIRHDQRDTSKSNSYIASKDKLNIYSQTEITLAHVSERYNTPSNTFVNIFEDNIDIYAPELSLHNQDVSIIAKKSINLAAEDISILTYSTTNTGAGIIAQNTSVYDSSGNVKATNRLDLKGGAVFVYNADIEDPRTLENKTRSLYLRVKYVNNDGLLTPESYIWDTTPTITLSNVDVPAGQNDPILLENGDCTLYRTTIGLRENDLLTERVTEETQRSNNTVFSPVVSEQKHHDIDTSIDNRHCRDLYARSIKSGKIHCRVIKPYYYTPNEPDFVELQTINGKSILQYDNNTNIRVVTPEELKDFHKIRYTNQSLQNNQQYKVFGAKPAELSKLNSPKTILDSSSLDAEVAALIEYHNAVYFKGNGSFYASGYYNNSDARLKKDIEDISEDIEMPEIKQFCWKSDSRKSYGFIAQDLEKIHPELVDEDNETGLKRVDYDAALSLVVGKLQLDVNKLKQENKELRETISKILENRF